MTSIGPGVHQFALVDFASVEHQYVVTEHPAGEGVELMFELLGLGAPSVATLAGAALASDDALRVAAGALTGGAGLAGGAAFIAKIQELGGAEKIGREVGVALLSGRAPGLTKRLISRVLRDGKPLAPVFDQACQANYWELLQLLYQVCQINRFFLALSTS